MAAREDVLTGTPFTPEAGRLLVQTTLTADERYLALKYLRPEQNACFPTPRYCSLAWMRGFVSRLNISGHLSALRHNWTFVVTREAFNVLAYATDDDIRAFILLRKMEPENGIPNMHLYHWQDAVSSLSDLAPEEAKRIRRIISEIQAPKLASAWKTL